MDETDEAWTDSARLCPMSCGASRFLRIARAALNCAIFTAHGLRRLLPSSMVCCRISIIPEVQPKLQSGSKPSPRRIRYPLHRHEPDLPQIVPRLFDQLMTEKGLPTKSFNVGGRRAASARRCLFLRSNPQIPSAAPPIYLSSNSMGFPVMPIDRNERGTSRNVYWHEFGSAFPYDFPASGLGRKKTVAPSPRVDQGTLEAEGGNLARRGFCRTPRALRGKHEQLRARGVYFSVIWRIRPGR